jgi:hypothetical protein
LTFMKKRRKGVEGIVASYATTVSGLVKKP